MNSRLIQILIVEDSPSDAFIVKEALKQAKELVQVLIVHDGVEAMDLLLRRGKYTDAPRPDVILLDLNMPRKDGREVLAEIKSHDKLKTIPVIVLTSSSAPQDISKAYSLHANCYLAKPADFNQFKQMIQAIETFWFRNVTLPPHD
jgi:two-component system, chemotaxis family, response regulator Rcp1